MLAVKHIRFEALFAIVTVIVGGAVLASALGALAERVKEARLGKTRWGTGLTVGAASFAVALACLRSADLVSDRSYLASTDLGSFGIGLSWWFPGGRLRSSNEKYTCTNLQHIQRGGYHLAWAPSIVTMLMVEPFRSDHNWLIETANCWRPRFTRMAARGGALQHQCYLVRLGRSNGLHLFPVLRRSG